jgi:IS30 family transposase
MCNPCPRFIPETITPERRLEVEDEINNRPRNVLAYQSPNDLLDHLRAS